MGVTPWSIKHFTATAAKVRSLKYNFGILIATHACLFVKYEHRQRMGNRYFNTTFIVHDRDETTWQDDIKMDNEERGCHVVD